MRALHNCQKNCLIISAIAILCGGCEDLHSSTSSPTDDPAAGSGSDSPNDPTGESSSGIAPARGMMAISSFGGADVEQMPALGVEFVRLFLKWNTFEPERGERDFSAIADEVSKYENIRPIIVLRPISEWGTVCERADRPDCPPKNYEDWTAFVNNLVTTLKPHQPLYEVGNEVNATGFWDPRKVPGPLDNEEAFLSDYLTFLEKTYEAVKAADNSATVLTSAMADGGSSEWDDAQRLRHDLFFSQILETDHYDAIAVHNYFYPDRIVNQHTFGSYLEHTRDMMAAVGRANVPVYITEMGYSSRTVTGGGGREDFNDLNTQAERLQQAYDLMTSEALGLDIKAFVWLRLFDSLYPETDGFPYFAYMGIADDSAGGIMERPAYYTYRHLGQ